MITEQLVNILRRKSRKAARKMTVLRVLGDLLRSTSADEHYRNIMEASKLCNIDKYRTSLDKSMVRFPNNQWAIEDISVGLYTDIRHETYRWSKSSKYFKDCLATLDWFIKTQRISIHNSAEKCDKMLAVVDEYLKKLQLID